MKRFVAYEWDVETYLDTDHSGDGDIVDHNHSQTAVDALSALREPQADPEGTIKTRLVLVRDVFDEGEDLVSRAWAYVEDGKLPAMFNDTTCDIAKVPQRFHKELAKALKS